MASPDRRLRREGYWSGIIIHHTGVGGRKEIDRVTWQKLFKRLVAYLSKKDKNYVSAHYVISRAGEVAELVDPEKYEAWHAGKSRYYCPIRRRVRDDWNRYAIGIELVGDGSLHEYSQEQYQAVTDLCRKLMIKYKSIHPLAIVGHENVSPRRKVDPGPKFDWKLFFRKLYCPNG